MLLLMAMRIVLIQTELSPQQSTGPRISPPTLRLLLRTRTLQLAFYKYRRGLVQVRLTRT